jgi:CRP-like cAMP-binding protein
VIRMAPDQALSCMQNRLLGAFPPEVYRRLRPNLLPVGLSLGEVVCERGERPEHAHFPLSAVVSLFYTTAEGATAEVGMTGNDGLVGLTALFDGGATPNRAIVQSAGRSLKIRTAVLQEEFARGGPLQRILLRYVQAFLTQVSQTAVCNRLHSVEKRLCRWLLLSHDRARSDRLFITQEFISNMLGSRRESVTVAAAALQDAGLIHYVRGNITILDRTRLEAAACECYQVVRNESERLLGPILRPCVTAESQFRKAVGSKAS